MAYLGATAQRMTLVDKDGNEVIMTGGSASQAVAVSNFPASLDLSREPVTQTLSGTGRITFDVTGMATLGLIVTGTAVMTCRYISTSGDPVTSTTSNRPWKAGASLGINVVGYTGTVNTEYRFVGGRKYFVIECTSYTSGSLTFKVYGITGSSILYVGGGIQDVTEEASIQGNMFNAATSFVSVSAGNNLNVVFENPAGSNKLAIIRKRRFSLSANGAFGGISNPTAASFDNQTGAAAPAVLSPSNLRTGSVAVPSPTSAMSVKMNMAATRVDSSPTTANPAGDFLAALTPFTLDVLRVVPPGSRFAHFIGGAGGGLAATASASIYLLWEERDLF